SWAWDGDLHIDPTKDATAQVTRLDGLLTTLAEEYAKEGKDWEQQLRQIAKETALKQDLGLTTAQVAPKAQQPEPEEEDTEEEQDAPE
ncbi:MAG: hypothetical protein HY000_14765, partial [Planctomycetes bacterium]|nr:hypothetical protein [Planctomycetota bacterium]